VSTLRCAEGSVEGYDLHEFALPADFQMPIEWDLALGKPGWKNLLRTSSVNTRSLVPHAACVQGSSRRKEE
jgi:hypothetical protein